MLHEKTLTVNDFEEERDKDKDINNMEASEYGAANRKERRKMTKKEKRKKKRKEMAEIARLEEESQLNDPDEQRRLQADEEKEKERIENERREFEERERKILEAWAKKRAIEEEEEERRSIVREEQSKINQVGYSNEVEADEHDWEYVEEGPPEIIWQGNEIIVKKKKVRVKRKDSGNQILKEDPNRPTSNPLPPQSEAFSDYKNASILSAQQLLDNVAQQTPNFGTEQDKAHCPFHLKTGACRFGSNCSRIHFYPDTSCTFLVKNMYNGPGLAWEQDEGLEYTDEEVERSYEEFYEDVHTEFLKFGEIVNFKVCRNGSSHLRGNTYVHYKTLESAVLAYRSVNGRYFGGKLLQCEFVGVTRWKVAICGEYMKSKLTTCSRGITCNFIHCFRNPGGDYEWADWDKPPPKYWVKRMAALFGYSDEAGDIKKVERGSSRSLRNSSRILADDSDRYQFRKSRSRETDFARSSRNYSEYDTQRSTHQLQDGSADRRQPGVEEKRYLKTLSSGDGDSDRDWLDRDRGRDRRYDRSKKTYTYSNLSDNDGDNYVPRGHLRKRTRHGEKRPAIRDRGCDAGSIGDSVYEDREKIVNQSGEGMSLRQHNKLSRSPDDLEGRSRTYDSDLTGDLSGSEADSAHGYKKKSLRSYNCEESVSRDYLDQEDEEVKQESRKASNCGRSHKSSDSNSRYNSRKNIVKSGCGESEKVLIPDYIKKSKRNGDGDKTFDARRRIKYHDGKKLHHTNYQVDEDVDKRGRWEPDKIVLAGNT